MPAHPILPPLPWPSPPAPVVATGNIITVDGSLLITGETFTLGDGVHPATVFEFDDGSGVTPGNVAVPFTGGDILATVKASIIGAVNGVGASLEITASSGGAGEILLANDTAGSPGNVTVTDTVADAGFTVSGLSGGLPTQLTLTSFDLVWLAMGGTLNEVASNTQIRLEPTTCRPGAFLRAYDASLLHPDLTAAAKLLNRMITSVAGYPAGGAAPTADNLSDDIQRSMDAETAHART